MVIPDWRFDMHFVEAPVPKPWLDDVLDDGAHEEDDDTFDERYMIGSGFDPSILAGDLEAGTFDAPPSGFAG